MGDGQVGSAKCRWGVIGAGRIAKEFVAQIPASQSGTLVAVASSDRTRALALAAEGENVVAYGDYAAMLADPDVDAVYIATLHPQHASLILACAEASKHVLCEKPLTVTGAEAVAAAAAAGVVLVEAMMYRFQGRPSAFARRSPTDLSGRPCPWMSRARSRLCSIQTTVSSIHPSAAAPSSMSAAIQCLSLGWSLVGRFGMTQ